MDRKRTRAGSARSFGISRSASSWLTMLLPSHTKVSNANAFNASSAAIASGAKVATVTVTAKRLSSAEKSQLLALDTVTAASRL